MKAEKFFTHPLGIVVAATATTFLWGSSLPFIKKSYEELSIGPQDFFAQILFAGYRFVLAALGILLVMLLVRKSISYQEGSWKRLVKVGAFQTFFQYLFFYIGLSTSSGIQGSIIAGTTSFFQIILAHLMFKNDGISTRKIVGLSIGFLGVVLVNMPNGQVTLNFGLSEILLLAAMFCGGLGNILSKQESAYLDILYLTAYQMLIGGIGLVAIGVSQVGFTPFQFDVSSSLMLIYLAFISGAGFVMWNNIMKYNKVGNVSMYLFLIPVFGVLLSAIILNESLHLVIFGALALVTAGIVIVNREKPVASQSIEIKTE
ncbi:DMT family transporter [Brevibacillus daliensis]|uniref:DMT family transporter n=1 Tax=Brevibacillus daliensis TaxID=2892995 RepID=UPI001E449E9E|nr:DMT family transporter [Brevibacillus daliensis]